MLIDLHPEPADMARLVIEGMERQPRQLPAWLLYDAEGSRLFEAICQQPEYGLTRTETKLLEAHAADLAASLAPPAGQPAVIVEFGAGNARKVGPLLRALTPRAYVALDISADHLAPACRELQAEHPAIPVLGICCDYSRLTRLPDHPLLRDGLRLGFYPGSSLGNFDPSEGRDLLRQFGRLLGPDSRLLVGIDQPREEARLVAAYDDRAGRSAAFAGNLLTRLNRDLDGSFDPSDFRYRAWWEADRSRIAMALISRRSHTVRLAGRSWRFEAGEPLITEYSHKYSPQAFADLAAAAGWQPAGRWSDPQEEVSLHLLLQADSGAGATDP
jgi:dimethylhistidine N-methyltransferase